MSYCHVCINDVHNSRLDVDIHVFVYAVILGSGSPKVGTIISIHSDSHLGAYLEKGT